MLAPLIHLRASKSGLCVSRAVSNSLLQSTRRVVVQGSNNLFSGLKVNKQRGVVSSVGDSNLKVSKNNNYSAFQGSAIAVGLILPVGLLLPVTPLNVVLDIILSITLPVHFFYGTEHILEDYLPEEAARKSSKVFLVVCIVAALGFFNMTFFGDGLLGTIKELWD